MQNSQHDIAKEALAEHFDESEVAEVFSGAREFRVLLTLPPEKYHSGDFMSEIDHSELSVSEERIKNARENVGGLVQNVYKRSFSSLGVHRGNPSFEPVTVEKSVAHELDDLQTNLPCDNRCDVIEYLMAYWASEGGLEKDYEFGHSSYELGSKRTSLLRVRNIDGYITKYW